MNALRPKWLAVMLLVSAVALHAGGPAPKSGGPPKPLEPKEAQKLFKLDAGLRIELVACEPQVQSPVAMAFDPDGRIWVVEMHDYPNGPKKGEKPQGRIRILEDKDGDGFYESATTWADNLLFANGLLLWKDGAIVTAAPNIAHLRDTDGDGKADRTDVLYTGFAAQNPQLRVSHPILGLDGWVYCANGLRGGSVVRAGDRDAKPVNLSGMDFRFHPITGAYEAISGQGQYGNAFDAWGRRFVCDNRHHLRHVVLEDRYIKRNPLLAVPSVVEDVSVLEDGPLSSGGKIYPLSRNWTTSSLHEGRFTAACGVHIYEGTLLGKQYKGTALTCDPTGNLVHMEVLTPKGATFTAKPHKAGVEFLATPDDWFRPVFLNTGPDGALYVVDMYRAVIEHPDFMPPELKNRPDLALGKDRGRIWRIVPEKHVTKAIRPNLAKATTAELVKLLEHDEIWWRKTAQRMLLERQDKAAIELLLKQFDQTKKPTAKLLDAYLLEGCRSLDDTQLLELLHSAHPRLREHGIHLAEPRLHRSLRLHKETFDLIGDDDSRVRFQVMLSLVGLDDSDIPVEIASRAWRNCADRWAGMAVATCPPKNASDLLEKLVRLKSKPEDPKGGRALLRNVATIVGSGNDNKAIMECLAVMYPVNAGIYSAERLAGIVGLAEGLERRGKSLLSFEAEGPKYRESYLELIEGLMSATAPKAVDATNTLEVRLLAIRLFSHATWKRAKATLVPLIADEPVIEVRLAALRALAAHTDREVPALLMKLWPSAGPAVRREILEAMLRNPDRIGFLLGEVEAKRVKSSEIDAVRTRQLVNHANAAIRDRARKLLQDNLPADRQAALKEYRAALPLKGDAKNGRDVFKKHCATCHKVGGVGIDVGPDIADTRTKTMEALLTDILVPNQAIDNNYVNYLVTTKDGRVLTGILVAETASSVTLKRAEGQTDVVLRKDVDEIVSTGVSLMPDGLEKGVSVQEMADLLRFLKDWRYLDGSVPVGR